MKYILTTISFLITSVVFSSVSHANDLKDLEQGSSVQLLNNIPVLPGNFEVKRFIQGDPKRHCRLELFFGGVGRPVADIVIVAHEDQDKLPRIEYIDDKEEGQLELKFRTKKKGGILSAIVCEFPIEEKTITLNEFKATFPELEFNAPEKLEFKL